MNLNEMKGNKKVLYTNLVFSLLLVLLTAFDRFTKNLAIRYLVKGDVVLIPNVLSLHYLENRGAAWGIFQNAFWLFIIIAVVVTAVMAVLYARMPYERHYWYMRFTIVLLLSGAIGNFIDRIMWHYVVDFIYFECIHFPVFNVADCFVCISAALLMYGILFYYKDEDLSWKKKS